MDKLREVINAAPQGLLPVHYARAGGDPWKHAVT
jgi:hypothetical protein